jgi:hypothetical protein
VRGARGPTRWITRAYLLWKRGASAFLGDRVRVAGGTGVNTGQPYGEVRVNGVGYGVRDVVWCGGVRGVGSHEGSYRRFQGRAGDPASGGARRDMM